MGKNYLIGVGGTGSRIVEAAVFMSAAGYGPENLSVFIIDPDAGNGNLTRTKEILALYRDIRTHFQPPAGSRLFQTDVRFPEEFVWSVCEEQNSQLSQYIGLDGIEKENKDLYDFVHVLFSKQELTTPLNEGFRGHPAIGSVMMANPPKDKEPFKSFWEDITNKPPNDVKVLLAGSIFGGTGAAGVPTMGSKEMIKFSEVAKQGNNSSVLLGGLLVLPYFEITMDSEAESIASKELCVTSKLFPIATKTALQFYNDKELGFDQIYFVGDSLAQPVGKFSPGKGAQRNKAHYIELVSCLASYDFFAQPKIVGKIDPKYFVAGRDGDSLTWEDLPTARDNDDITVRQATLKSMLTSMTVFSYAMTTYGKSILGEPHEDEKVKKPSWYMDNFKYDETSEKDRMKNLRAGDNRALLNNVQKFCTRYLEWIASLDSDDNKVNLIDSHKLFDGKTLVDLGKGGELLPSPLDHNENKHNIGGLLKNTASQGMNVDTFISKLNSTEISEKATVGARRFIQLFYKTSYDFSKQNYKIK